MILLEQKGPVATLTLNRPEKRNALTLEMISTLSNHLQTLESSSETFILLKGSSGHFCSGADLTQPFEPIFLQLSKLYTQIYNHPKIIIAQVEGICFAGGLGLVLAADLATASESARFCLPEIKRGLLPALVMTLLKQIAPKRFILDIAFTGREFNFSEAIQVGIIQNINLENLIKNPPKTLLRIKKLERALSLKLDFSQAIGLQKESFLSPEFKEGVDSFVQNPS